MRTNSSPAAADTAGRREGVLRWLAWLPVGVLVGLLAVGLLVEPDATFDPPWLVTPLNLVFLSLLPAAAAVLAVAAYRRTGVLAVLAIGAAMVTTAVGAGVVPALLLFAVGVNGTITVHNSAALVAALFHLGAALAGILGLALGIHRVRHVAVAYGIAAGAVGAVLGALFAGLTPPFWADGPTGIRQLVLGTAALAMFLAAFAWWQTAVRDRGIRFLWWYVPGLTLFALGLLCVLTQDRVGGLVGWIGRAGQYAGATWMLIAVAIGSGVRWGRAGAAAPTPSPVVDGTLGVSLLQAALPFRPLVESTSDAVIAIGRTGTVVYWNDAAARMFGTDPETAFDRDPLALLAGDGGSAEPALQAALGAPQPTAGDGRTEMVLRRRDGSTFPAEVRVLASPDDNRLRVLVVTDITERVHWQRELEQRVGERTAQLEAANDALQRANAAKDEFLGLVSHELKTPITTILAATPLLERRLGAQDEDALIRDVAVEASRLAGIVDNLLALARLEAGQPPVTEPVALERLAMRAAAEARRASPERTIELVVAAEGLIVEANEDHLLMIIRNLLANAVKYSPAGSPIRLTLARDGGMARVEVRDHGRGFLGEDPETLFDSFQRGPGAADQPGMGIGLAVVRRVVASLGGRVWAVEAADGGAVFSFTLPLAPDDESRDNEG